MIYVGGTFDLFHAGHVNFLRQCKRVTSDAGIVVGLNRDGFIRKFKGKAPVMSYEERASVLMGCKYVTHVVPNIGDSDSKITITRYMQEIITGVDGEIKMVVIGSDWHEKDYMKQMGFTWKWLGGHGIGLCYVQYTPNISTTKIKKRLCQN